MTPGKESLGDDFLETDPEPSKIESMLAEILSELKTTKKKKPEEPYEYPEKEQLTALQKEKEELEKKLGEFQLKEKEEKVNEYIGDLVEKGLILEDHRKDLAKEYSEKFSIEQLDALIESSAKMDFKRAKQKSFAAGGEPAGKDSEKQQEDLELKLQDLEAAGIKGPVFDDATAELKAMKEAN